MSLPTLRGRSCLLRELRVEDAAALRRHADDPAVARNLLDPFPQPYTQADAQLWCGGQWRMGGRVWGIEVQGEVIGCIGLRAEEGWLRCNAEVGYWIGQAFWRRGIVSEALGLVSDWVWREQPQITRIYAPIFGWNEGSMAVAKSCGYEVESRLPRSAYKDGQLIDRVVFARYRTIPA